MRVSSGRRATPGRAGSVLVLLMALGGLPGCDEDNAAAPPLAGPSGLALAIEMGAAPVFLNADGRSTSTVTVTVRGPNGAPVAGQPLFVQHDGDGLLIAGAAIGGLQTGISLQADGSGVAQLAYRAGTERDRLVTIRCEPYSPNVGFTGELPRTVVIHQR